MSKIPKSKTNLQKLRNTNRANYENIRSWTIQVINPKSKAQNPKHQEIQNPKLKIQNKFQIQNSNFQNKFQTLIIRILILFWILDLGFWIYLYLEFEILEFCFYLGYTTLFRSSLYSYFVTQNFSLKSSENCFYKLLPAEFFGSFFAFF